MLINAFTIHVDFEFPTAPLPGSCSRDRELWAPKAKCKTNRKEQERSWVGSSLLSLPMTSTLPLLPLRTTGEWRRKRKEPASCWPDPRNTPNIRSSSKRNGRRSVSSTWVWRFQSDHASFRP